MRVGLFFSRGVLAGVLVAIILGAMPVSGASYTVGVKVGDWMKYEVAGTVPLISEYEWVRYEIKNVKGLEVTFEIIIYYRDGGENIDYYMWDIETGSAPWIIPADLNTDDAFPFRNNTASMNATFPRIYGGASRTVHLLNLSKYDEYTELLGYWDQATGCLLELVLNHSSPTERWTGGYRLIETNLWSPTLDVTMELSSETVTQGESVTVSAALKDLSGNQIGGATVVATLGQKTVPLSDQGRGEYEGLIDTFDVGEGAYLVTVTAEKEGSESAQEAELLTVMAGTPWLLYIGLATILLVIGAVILYKVKRG
jgi:hypothetical protein